MKLHYLKSASVIIESNNIRILTDPWLFDGAYYGSWAHYPPFKYDNKYFKNIDYIYISHIHPDHLDHKSLIKQNKKTPIIIHNYKEKFLKKNIEKLGNPIIELNHDESLNLGNNTKLSIYAADNCNPDICKKFLGCDLYNGDKEPKKGSGQIDSICVVQNETFNIVNVNDCPIKLANTAMQKIKNKLKNINLLLHGYAGAGEYPQCFNGMFTEQELILEAQKKKYDFLKQGEDYITKLKPEFYMPFAGTYTLAGKASVLNDYRGVPEIEDARAYYQKSEQINQTKSKCIILNSYGTLDLKTRKTTQVYKLINKKEKVDYINKTLSKRLMTFERDRIPKFDKVIELLPIAYRKMEVKRKKYHYESNMTVFIDAGYHKLFCITMNGNGWKLIKKSELKEYKKYLKISLDSRLLLKLLKGPKYAHWNNASIGSHLNFFRKPNKDDRGLRYCINFLHI